MKTYMLYLKNAKGEYEPTAIGCFKELIPLAFGHIAKFECLEKQSSWFYPLGLTQGINFVSYHDSNLGYHPLPEESTRGNQGIVETSVQETMLHPCL